MAVEPIAPHLQPLRVSVRVERPPQEAFSVFTEKFARWWPLATHSLGRDQAVTCGIEAEVGGLVYEVGADGVRVGWGRVLAWEPPRRLLLSWHPGRPEAQAQEVEVLFVADGTGTRVELEHRDWQKLAGEAESVRGSYAEGWAGVLQRYARATAP